MISPSGNACTSLYILLLLAKMLMKEWMKKFVMSTAPVCTLQSAGELSSSPSGKAIEPAFSLNLCTALHSLFCTHAAAASHVDIRRERERERERERGGECCRKIGGDATRRTFAAAGSFGWPCTSIRNFVLRTVIVRENLKYSLHKKNLN